MKPSIISLNGKTPRIHESAFIAPNAVIAGDIEIGPHVSVWYGTVLRSEYVPVKIGAKTSLQDNVVLHTNPFMSRDAIIIGEEVSVGHGAILHHCRVGNRALVGMGSIVLDGSELGEESVVAAGSLVSMNTKVPPRSMIVGNPAKIRGEVNPEQLARFARGMRWYVSMKELHRDPCTRIELDINM